ncbi:hypothetical protein Y1Q_0014026 [Alligator mississippiensis]|uniref:Uncharacterized protein n=1 Tax=Alligator mississippiensis TaxID=8496 RepID=A0A151PDD5_ALLMI|nr:hypothetical protein Y1Q_0014026 [Alligator mississippiensis]
MISCSVHGSRCYSTPIPPVRSYPLRQVPEVVTFTLQDWTHQQTSFLRSYAGSRHLSKLFTGFHQLHG